MALCSIGSVAWYYGVSVSTIRRWEAKGIIPKSIRTFGGHRRFD
ncbi:MAG: MerR family DNA-binding transcriptional regulator, partial [Sutterella wadsworthensis]|nr:MerR family DNA-binding transcriptional regulator [Sutterella wadsworthensis]